MGGDQVNALVPVLMLLVAAWFFRMAFLRTKARMDTEVRDVV